MKKALELSSGAVSVRCISAYVHAILGEREVAQKTLDEVSALSKTEYVSPYYLAILHATLGNREEFFASIGRAVEDRSAEIESLLHDPMFELFRSDPRFDGILGKTGVLKIGEGQGERGARAVG
jgi:hypothetical protein